MAAGNRDQEREKVKKPAKSQIQPTLKSFLDQKSGLVGPEAMPSQQGKGNQVAAGRDLSLGPKGGQPKEAGVWWKEKGARLEGLRKGQ